MERTELKKPRRWLKAFGFALLISGAPHQMIWTVRNSYQKLFWRVYRLGPGITFNALVRMAFDNARN